MNLSVDSGGVVVHAPNDRLKVYNEDAHLTPGGARVIARCLKAEGEDKMAAQL